MRETETARTRDCSNDGHAVEKTEKSGRWVMGSGRVTALSQFVKLLYQTDTDSCRNIQDRLRFKSRWNVWFIEDLDNRNSCFNR